MKKVFLDEIGGTLRKTYTDMFIVNMVHWRQLPAEEGQKILDYMPTKRFEGLSTPQLIVLYGRMWEKHILPEQLKELEEYTYD